MCRCFYTRPVNSWIIGGSNRAKQLFWQVKIDRSNNQLLRGKFGEVLRGRLADDWGREKARCKNWFSEILRVYGGNLTALDTRDFLNPISSIQEISYTIWCIYCALIILCRGGSPFTLKSKAQTDVFQKFSCFWLLKCKPARSVGLRHNNHHNALSLSTCLTSTFRISRSTGICVGPKTEASNLCVLRLPT